METIAPSVTWFTREDWGADVSLPQLGELLNPAEATEAIMHHTVVVDKDATPNLWENLLECFVKMRQLQTIRPDLGLDVPYSGVAFLMRYSDGQREVALMEGRGFAVRGAHTMYHNRTGRAIAIEGNLELAVNVAPYVQMLSRAWGWAKDRYSLANLGTIRPPRGQVWGHKNFAQTACPGASLMAVIEQIKIDLPPKEEEMVKLLRLGDDDGHGGLRWTAYTYITDGFEKRHVTNPDALKELQDAGVWPSGDIPLVSQAALAELEGDL